MGMNMNKLMKQAQKMQDLHVLEVFQKSLMI